MSLCRHSLGWIFGILDVRSGIEIIDPSKLINNNTRVIIDVLLGDPPQPNHIPVKQFSAQRFSHKDTLPQMGVNRPLTLASLHSILVNSASSVATSMWIAFLVISSWEGQLRNWLLSCLGMRGTFLRMAMVGISLFQSETILWSSMMHYNEETNTKLVGFRKVFFRLVLHWLSK